MQDAVDHRTSLDLSATPPPSTNGHHPYRLNWNRHPVRESFHDSYRLRCRAIRLTPDEDSGLSKSSCRNRRSRWPHLAERERNRAIEVCGESGNGEGGNEQPGVRKWEGPCPTSLRGHTSAPPAMLAGRGYLLTCFAIASHAFWHFRHSSAHAFMCLSSGNFSQAFAHWSQHFAQQSAMRALCGPPLAHT